MNRQLTSHLALFGANLIYGLNYTVAKGIMPDFIGPSGFIFLRVMGAGILFWITLQFFQKEKVHKSDHLRLLICGLFGVATNQLLFFNGLNLTTPINAAIIMTSNPILVLIIAAVLIKERITLLKFSGILIGACGAIFMILMSNKSSQIEGANIPLGNLMVFINAASYGVYLVMVKPLMRKYRPITIISWVFAYGFLFVIPIGWSQFQEINWSFPTEIWVGLLFVIFGTTFLAYLLNIFALKRVSPSIVSIYIYLQPLLAAMFALALNKDKIEGYMLIAAALIFTGVYLVSKPVGNRG